MRPSRLDRSCPTSSRWEWYDTKVVEKRSVSSTFLRKKTLMKKREPTSVWHGGVSHLCAGPRRGKVVWDSHHLRSSRSAPSVVMSIPEFFPPRHPDSWHLPVYALTKASDLFGGLSSVGTVGPYG
uniref:Uncharacterized protein n=1 Tax=Plasmopara viticola lesion associated ourmia-like virus 35 TaxID=2686504 RepID=A0A9E8Z1B6_9VIRU|nr:MAG: hypothetical protein [Plasmopara viticola lesion associated ourmia-like virus 35]